MFRYYLKEDNSPLINISISDCPKKAQECRTGSQEVVLINAKKMRKEPF